jgi:hypothetical protein
MKLPAWLIALSFAGLVPFIAGPLAAWQGITALGESPIAMDALWRTYVMLVAVFLAGSFWGFALVAVNGAAGAAGILMASASMLLAWGTSVLPFREALYALAVIFLLLLLADFWRERALDTIPGYFTMRAILTAGAIASIAARAALP